MTAITNLFMNFDYPIGQTNCPILVLEHGWAEDASEMTIGTLRRFALAGFFVVSVGMRGRNSATGTRDASGREIMDIYDAVQYIRANYASIVDPNKAAISGYSGGGGNALACACKLPDMFNVVVSHFGMSDYGRDGTNGWYYNNNGDYTTQIRDSVGGTPVAKPNNYYARDTTVAIPNYTGGFLYLYHDQQDTSVLYVHSARIKTAMDNASLSNYSYNLSNTGDNPRWLHGNPESSPQLQQAEPTWTAKILSQAAWTVPTAATHTVIGYEITKRFTIWLNQHGTASLGIDAAATVVYDTTANTYTVTPLTTGGIDVSITQGAKTGSASNITSATLITVA
jgi:pimeloyl-ACP methyl ester carboxylesterase